MLRNGATETEFSRKNSVSLRALYFFIEKPFRSKTQTFMFEIQIALARLCLILLTKNGILVLPIRDRI